MLLVAMQLAVKSRSKVNFMKRGSKHITVSYVTVRSYVSAWEVFTTGEGPKNKVTVRYESSLDKYACCQSDASHQNVIDVAI